jgi:hypothetical protein
MMDRQRELKNHSNPVFKGLLLHVAVGTIDVQDRFWMGSGREGTNVKRRTQLDKDNTY